MPSLRSGFKIAIFFVTLSATIIQISVEDTNVSKCRSPFLVNVTIEYDGSHVRSNCKSSSLNINTEGGNTFDYNGGNSNYRKLSERITDDEEIVKEDFKIELLRKLRISDRPNGSISNSPLSTSDIKYVKNLLQPEFIGKEITEPYKYKVLFAISEKKSFYMRRLARSELKYRIDTKLIMDEVKSIEIWFFNSRNYNGTNNETKLLFTESRRESGEVKTSTGYIWLQGGKWSRIPLNVPNAIEMLDPDEPYDLQIGCSPCKEYLLPEDASYGMKPFILIEMKVPPSDESIVEWDHSKLQNKWPITMDFKSLDLEEWIVFPERFTINYCRGSCTSDFDERFCKYPTIKQLSDRNKSPWDAPMSICSAPIIVSPLEIAYMKSDFVVVFTTVPGMIVEECGCVWKKT